MVHSCGNRRARRRGGVISELIQQQNEPDSPATSRGRIRRLVPRVWRWGGRLALALFVVALVYVAWTNHRGTRAIAALEQSLIDRNVPATFEQWREEHFGPLEQEKDGTHWYQAAMKIAQAPRTDASDLPFLGRGDEPEQTVAVHPDTAAVVAEFLQAHETAFVLVDRAREYEQFNFGVVGHEQPGFIRMELFGSARQLARWLQLRNLHGQATGDPELATQSILAVLQLNMALEHEPMLVTELVRMSIDALAIGMVEDTIGRIEVTDEHLDGMRAALQRRRESMALERVMQSDLTLTLVGGSDRDLMIYGMMEARKAMRDLPDFSELPPLGDLFDDMRARWSVPRVPDGLYRIWLALCPGRLELAAADEGRRTLELHDAIAAAGDDWKALARYAHGHAVEGEYGDPHLSISPALQVHARLAATEVGLAVEQFRLAEGRWPNDLAEVEDTLQQDLPADPYTGDPHRYRPTDTGVLVYSVGDNFSDDDGHGRWDEHPNGREARDEVFQLFDVERRNRAE